MFRVTRTVALVEWGSSSPILILYYRDILTFGKASLTGEQRMVTAKKRGHKLRSKN